ncbi:MAG: Na+-transporting NADH:ubiquinone oxidoreductase subunit F, partial [Planctomycetota bacterium]
MDTFFLGVAAFTVVALSIVGILLIARSQLVSGGVVNIIVNGDESQPIKANAGGTLLATLADRKLFIPSACGGGGTCAQCIVKITEGGGDLLPTET